MQPLQREVRGLHPGNRLRRGGSPLPVLQGVGRRGLSVQEAGLGSASSHKGAEGWTTPARTNPSSWHAVSGVAGTLALAIRAARSRMSCGDILVRLWLLLPCSQLFPQTTLWGRWGGPFPTLRGRPPSSIYSAQQQTRLWLPLTPLVSEAYARGVRP